MNTCVGLGRLFAISLIIAPTAASAGAWTLGTGQAEEDVTVTSSRSDNAFNGSGNLQSIPTYNKSELEALLEYGATDWLTLMLAPSLQHIDIGSPYNAERSGFGYTEMGDRIRVLQGDSWVFSVQTTLRLPGTFDNTNPAAIGYTDTEADVRGLFGYNFKAGSWPAFIDVEVAQRFRFDGPPDEFHADFTFGVQPNDRWMFLAQSFNVTSEGAGTWGYPSYGYYKLQLSAVYAWSRALSLQLGGYTTYHGNNALQENGMVLGAWYKF